MLINSKVVYNSLGNREIQASSNLTRVRKALCANIGFLYPERTLLNATTIDTLRSSVRGVENYE